MTSDATSETPTMARPQNRNLKPWRKGVSGNPSGVAGGGRRFSERYSALAAELEVNGIRLTAGECVALEMAVRLSLRHPKDDHAAAQAASTVHRLLAPMYARRKPTGNGDKAANGKTAADDLPSVMYIIRGRRHG